MGKGEVALVLHAHLPYVRSEEFGSLEEDWFFQALLECYLPLLDILEIAASDPDQNPKITISLSPTLLSLLNDREITQRFPAWLDVRLKLLGKASNEQQSAANHLEEIIQKQLKKWNECQGEVTNRFAALQKANVVDILTCAATHGYLPLLREHPEIIKGQLLTAVKEHNRLIGEHPLGIWLPECAYYEGLDKLMVDSGLRYAVLDGHGLLNANPRPRYGLYSPICSKNGVAFFGRDSDSTLPVWSAHEGFPGNPVYREFHRDLGWELSKEDLNKINLKEPRPLGLKLNRVTHKSASLENKEAYQPKPAREKVKQHAMKYLIDRKKQLESIQGQVNTNTVLIAPFDAELFGHWWFEGPIFLKELFLQANNQQVNFTRLKDVLLTRPQLQLSDPSPSSWGKGGYHDYWLNETNAWIISEWSKAGLAMVKSCRTFKKSDKYQLRLLKQAAKELLLAQSSDWSFILRAGTTTELAKERINKHLKRFWKLIDNIKEPLNLDKSWLVKVESEDNLFPLIDISDWT